MFFLFFLFLREKNIASGFRGSVQRAMVKHGNQQKMQPMSATEKRLKKNDESTLYCSCDKVTTPGRCPHSGGEPRDRARGWPRYNRFITPEPRCGGARRESQQRESQRRESRARKRQKRWRLPDGGAA